MFIWEFFFLYVFDGDVPCLNSCITVTSSRMHGDVLSKEAASTWSRWHQIIKWHFCVKNGVHCNFDYCDINDHGRMEIDHNFPPGAGVGYASTHACWRGQPRLLAPNRSQFLQFRCLNVTSTQHRDTTFGFLRFDDFALFMFWLQGNDSIQNDVNVTFITRCSIHNFETEMKR